MAPGDFGQLSGFDVDVDGRRLRLGDRLGTHADRSVTYKTSDNLDGLVVRVFFRAPQADSTALLLGEPDLKGVWSYLIAGDAELHSPESRTAKSRLRKAWVTVRRFVPTTLKDALAAPRAPAFDSYRLAIDVAEGLRSLHRNHIVHGDLRPSNVLSSADGFQVADYGLAFDRRIRTGDPRYLAPEFLMHGHGNSASADIYSFGKLIREASHGRSPVAEHERDLMLELVERCLVIDPAARPTIEDVLSILYRTASPPWTEANLRDLNFAVLADLDARVPYGVTARHNEWLLPRLVNWTGRRVAADLARRNTFRVAQLTDLEMVHFLGTAAFMDPRSEALTALTATSGRILKAVDVDFAEGIASGSRTPASPPAPVLEAVLDPQWAQEIAEATLRDSRETETEDEKRARVSAQLEAASELTHSALHSDSFVHSEQVALMMASRCPGITPEEVRILRDMGYLISLPVDQRNLYPLFQFDRAGMPLPVVKDVSDLLDFERSTWGNCIWWFLNHPALAHNTPIAWLRDGNDPAAVTALFARVVA